MIIKDRLIERVLAYYKSHYDYRDLKGSGELAIARMDLHVSNRKFFLFKSNILWEANCHEYVYLFDVEHLSVDIYKQIEDYVCTKGMPLVEPKKNHMYTYLTALIVAESADKEAVKELKKCRKRKDFKFSLHGWMEVHCALIDCENAVAYTNPAARGLSKLLKKLVTRGNTKKEEL